MRFGRKGGAGFAEGDMTPMIDMTFQLIAFFMVLVNFSEADQNQRIRLPSSELAKPPDGPVQSPITLQLTDKGTIIFGPDETTLAGLRPLLARERTVIDNTPGRSTAEATVIIRADRNAQTGRVQEVIGVCQDVGFEKFALRAKQEEAGLQGGRT
ncbi:MAG: biopolymer transporter ExbD [Pirellulales bacterium]|nr:biopolymer transporter ExbD [Pirellulales bacterium]